MVQRCLSESNLGQIRAAAAAASDVSPSPSHISADVSSRTLARALQGCWYLLWPAGGVTKHTARLCQRGEEVFSQMVSSCQGEQ